MSEESTEEFLVYAELDDTVNIDSYRSIHVLGIDNKNPIIQMDNSFFTGKFEHPMGTYMFFEENTTPECSDPLFDKLPDKNLKYLCKTRKFIKLGHTYVTPKECADKEVINRLQPPEDEVEVVNFATIQEAIEKFKNEWKNTDTPELSSSNINLHHDESNSIAKVETNKMDIS